MKNTLELFSTYTGWIAIFNGETGMGEMVSEEEAHDVSGDSDDERVCNALSVWGADVEETKVEIS